MGIWKPSAASVGKQGDYVVVPYSTSDITSIMGFLQTGYYHVHGAAFIYPDKAVPVELTAAAPAWGEGGDIIEVIPANAIKKDFDLHWASVWAISAVLYGVIDIFKGPALSEEKIGSVDIGRTANFSRESAMPVQVSQQAANTRISCRLTTSTTNADTCRVKFYGHVYSTSLT